MSQIEVTVTGFVRDEGTVVLFEGITDDDEGAFVVFAVDHRPAQDIASALEDDCDVHVSVPQYQIVRKLPSPVR